MHQIMGYRYQKYPQGSSHQGWDQMERLTPWLMILTGDLEHWNSFQVLELILRLQLKESLTAVIQLFPTQTHPGRHLNMYISQLQDTEIYLNQFRDDFLLGLFQQVSIRLQAVLGIFIIASLLALLGVVATYFFQTFICKSIVSFAWSLLGLGFIGSVVIIYVTLGLGSLGYGFCNYFDSILLSESTFSQLGAADSQNPFVRIDSCFHGDGNVLDKFALGQEMGTVTSLFANIQSFYNLDNPLNTSYIDKTLSTGKIAGWIGVIQNYKRGVFFDFNQSITTEDNPNYVLNKLALYTLNGTGFPLCSKDRWVFDSVNCTNFNQTVLYGRLISQWGYSIIKYQCHLYQFQLKVFLTLQTTEWTQNDFTQSTLKLEGAARMPMIKFFYIGYSLIRYRTVDKIYFRLNLQQKFSININLTTFKQRVINFQSAASDLSNAVSNSIDGLLCLIRLFLYNMFCINAMHSIIQIGYCAILLAIFSLIAMISGYVFSLWFQDIKNNNKMFEDGYVADQLVSSTQILAQEKDLGKDLQKLGEFKTSIGMGTTAQQKQEKKNLQITIVMTQVNKRIPMQKIQAKYESQQKVQQVKISEIKANQESHWT